MTITSNTPSGSPYKEVGFRCIGRVGILLGPTPNFFLFFFNFYFLMKKKNHSEPYNIRTDWELFSIFSRKKEEDFAAARLHTILATSWTGNTFFYGQPQSATSTLQLRCMQEICDLYVTNGDKSTVIRLIFIQTLMNLAMVLVTFCKSRYFCMYTFLRIYENGQFRLD